MGATLSELRRVAKKWEPKEASSYTRDTDKLVEAYLKRHPELGEHKDIVDPFEPTEPSENVQGDQAIAEIDQQTTDFVQSVDHLDTTYTLLCDIMNSKAQFSQELNYRLSETIDVVGDFLEAVAGLSITGIVH